MLNDLYLAITNEHHDYNNSNENRKKTLWHSEEDIKRQTFEKKVH